MAGHSTSLWALAAALVLVPLGTVEAQKSTAAETTETSATPKAVSANPSLLAFERGIDTGQRDEKTLSFSSIRFDVTMRGRTADIVMEAQIANHSDRQMEGRFSLALPQDAVVTGYALDVEGRMIEGALMDQPKARAVYKREVRGQVDPGLAEVSGGNRFSTSIYPVMPRSSRTIRVRFSAPFGSDTGLVIPLQTAMPVGRFGVFANNVGGDAPSIRLAGKPLASRGGLDGAETWEKPLDGALIIQPASLPPGLIVSRHSNGKDYFQLSGTSIGTPAVRSGERVRIYWDTSLSRRDDLLAEEIAMLERLLTARRPAAIELVTFSAHDTRVEQITNVAQLGARLRGVSYGGGTSLRGLAAATKAQADSCLLFSDGETTLDLAASFAPQCRMTVVSSAPDANRVRLNRIARMGGGTLVTLDKNNAATMADTLGTRAATAPLLKGSDGRPLPVRSFADGKGGWLVVAPVPADRVVMLSDTIMTAGGGAPSDAAGSLWAAEQVVALSDNPLDRAAMREMALSHRVASPTMAFLVLESPRQYVNAGIVPPQGYSAQWMADYAETKAADDANKIAVKEERLAFVLKEWAQRKLWWGKSYSGNYVKPKPRPMVGHPVHGEPVPPPPPPSPVAAASAPQPPVPMMAERAAASYEEAIVTTGNRVSATPTAPARPAMEAKIANVLSDQPYLRELDAAPVAARKAVLAKQADTFGTNPAFYFDTAEWFRLKGDKATALRQLLSALELPIADDETRQIVAFRLQRDGDIDSAIAILERIAVTSDYRPQPKRQLALALAERGRRAGAAAGRADLERAFRLLTEVALEPANQAFDGIEVIALMEANALIPAIEAAGGTWALDPRLTGLLDTDVRILTEWTSDAADLDLHVIEPSGEEVFYGHQLSMAGGLLSNDMTAGYGPEEYVIRKARNGSYKVAVHGFAPDRLNPNGKGRLMVRLIRNFGRPNQQEQLIDADLNFDRSSGENKREVATVTVGAQK